MSQSLFSVSSISPTGHCLILFSLPGKDPGRKELPGGAQAALCLPEASQPIPQLYPAQGQGEEGGNSRSRTHESGFAINIISTFALVFGVWVSPLK